MGHFVSPLSFDSASTSITSETSSYSVKSWFMQSCYENDVEYSFDYSFAYDILLTSSLFFWLLVKLMILTVLLTCHVGCRYTTKGTR